MSKVFIAREMQQSPDKMEQVGVDPSMSLQAFAKAHDLGGYLANIGGGVDDFIFDGDWQDTLIGDDQVVIFVNAPANGDSDVIGFIASIAVAAFAPVLAPMIFGANAGVLAVGLTTIGLQAVVGALIPPPQAPRPQRAPEPSPQYSARVQTNLARPGEPVPIQFGRVPNALPDMVAPEYYDYEDDNQFINIRYCHGLGDYVFHRFSYRNINTDDIPGAQVEVVGPGETGALLPANTFPAFDIPGGDIGTDWTPGVVSCPKGEEVDKIVVDAGLLTGLGKFENNGSLTDHTVTLQWRYRLVNDTNTPIGSWVDLIATSLTDNTVDPLRRTFSAIATKGRHEVQMKVASLPPDNDERRKLRYKVTWAGLRGQNSDHVIHNDRTKINVRLQVSKGSSKLIGDTLRNFRVDSTALNREWDGSTWHENVASRSIAWAFAKAYSASYMGKRDINRLWIDDLSALHAKLEGLNHHFDYRFDQALSLQEGLEFIASYGRAVAIPFSGTYLLVRDEPQQAITHVFQPDNTRNFKLTSTYQSDGSYDHTILTYSDPVTGQPTEVIYAPDGSAKEYPNRIPFLGCSSREHALSEAEFLYWAHKENTTGSLENNNLKKPITFGSKVLTPQTQLIGRQWGVVKRQDGNNITLSNPHGITGAASIALDDHYHDVVILTVNSVVDGSTVNVTLPASGLDIVDDYQDKPPTAYLLADANVNMLTMRVKSIGGESEGWRSVNLVSEGVSEPVVNDDQPVSENIPGENLTINNLAIAQVPDGERYIIKCAINALIAADSYICQINTQAGAWRTIYAGGDVQWEFIANAGETMQIRVAAIGSVQGQWFAKTITVGLANDTQVLPAPDEVTGYFTPGGDLVLLAAQVPGAKAYQWAIYDTDTFALRYSIDQGDKFTYTLQQATENGGPWRRVTVRVFALDANNNGSLEYASGVFVDAQIGVPTNVIVTGFTETIGINWDIPQGALSTLIYASQVNGFAPSVFNFKIEAFGNQASFKVPHNSLWYIRLASRDYLGADDLVFTQQFTVRANLLSIADFDGQLPPEKVQDLLQTMQDLSQAQQDIAQALLDIQVGENERVVIEQSVNTLSAQMGDNQANISTVQQAISGETTARVLADQTLSAANAANESEIQTVQGAVVDETTARVLADQTLTAANATNTSAINNAQIAITDETNTRATQYASLTSSIGTTDNNVASLQQSFATQANAITGLESRYVLKVQAGSQFGGVVIQATQKADGTGSTDIAFLGSTFKVVSTVNGAPITPFKIIGNTIGMDGNVVLQGTLHADKLNIGSLSSISANIGTVTAGKIQSPNGHRLISMTQSDTTGTFIRSQDANGVNQFYVLNNGLVYCKNLTAQGNIEASTLKANVVMVNTLNVASQAITQVTGIRNRAEVLPFEHSWGGGELVFSKVFPSGVASDPIIHFGALLEHHYEFDENGGNETKSYIYSRLLVNGVEQFSIPPPLYRFGAHIPLSFSIQLPLIGFTTIKLQFRRTNNTFASKASERFIRVEEFLR